MNTVCIHMFHSEDIICKLLSVRRCQFTHCSDAYKSYPIYLRIHPKFLKNKTNSLPVVVARKL